MEQTRKFLTTKRFQIYLEIYGAAKGRIAQQFPANSGNDIITSPLPKGPKIGLSGIWNSRTFLYFSGLDDVNEFRLQKRKKEFIRSRDYQKNMKPIKKRRAIITFREAPPTRKPSISGCPANSLELPPFTDPA